MACILNFDATKLDEIPECPAMCAPWAMEGRVTWVGTDDELGSFKIEKYLVHAKMSALPEWLIIGETIRVSFDGESSRIELVKQE